MWLKTRLKRVLGVLAALVLAIGMMPTGSAVAGMSDVYINYTVSPATTVPGTSDVRFMLVYPLSDAAGDTLQQLTVQYTGDDAADVTQVKLYDLNEHLLQSVPLSNGKAVFAMNLSMSGSVPDVIRVKADFSPAAIPGHTAALTVEPGGFVFQKSGTVPFSTTAHWPVTIQTDAPLPPNPAISSFPPVNYASRMAAPISGTADSGATVNITVTGTGAPPVHATTNANVDGTWSAVVDVSTFFDGALQAEAVATDAAGHAGPGPSGKASTLLYARLPSLSLTSPAYFNQSHQTGTIPYMISGSTDTGATVKLTIPGIPDPLQTVASDGTFSFTPDLTGLQEGAVAATVTATTANAAANTATKVLSITKDTEVRPNTVLLDNGNATLSNYRHWPVNGRAELGAQVAISVDNAIPGGPAPVTASTQADYQGLYSFTLDVSSLDDGVLTLSVTQTDKAGNTATVTKAAVKDINPPGTLSILSFPPWVDDNSNTAVPISGTRAYMSDTVTVVITDWAFPVHSASATTINYDGLNWSATVNVAGLDDGTLTATVQAWDAAGNPGGTTFTQTLMATDFPAAPTDVVFRPVNNALKAAAPISGKALAQIKVDIVVTDTAGHRASHNVLSDSGGNWSTTVDVSGLVDGPITASVSAINAKRYGSLPTTINSIKDTIAPAAPVVSYFLPIKNTSQAAFQLAGVADAGGVVTATVTSAGGGTPVTATATANGGGLFGMGLNLSGLGDGGLTAKVSVADAAGNASGVTTVTVTKDTTAPTIASAAVAFTKHSTVNSNYQYYAWNRPATITATASEPVTWSWAVKDRFGNTVATSSTAVASSSLSVDWAPAQYAASGNYTVTLSATDLALYPVAAPVTLTIPVYNYDFRISGTRILNGSMTPTDTVTAGSDYHVEVTIENLNASAGTAYTVFQERQGAVRAFTTAAQEVPGRTAAAFTFLWRPTSGSTEIDFFVWNQLALSDRGARSADYHTTITVN